jgi:dTMP kinase
LLIEAPPTLGWAPLSEALLYYAARNEHIEKTIRPALARGTWVISDRFADSTAAYQGAGLALGVNVFDCLSQLVMGNFAPDLTFILDLATEEALNRAAARVSPLDRYERMDLEFHRRVRAAFIEIAHRGGRRYALIDAAPDVRRVQQAVRETVRDRFGVELTG